MPVETTPLTPSDADAWLDFFDHRAFADNPDWGGCYCRAYLFDHGDSFDAWDAACSSGANRAPMAEAIRRGEVDGILARVDGAVVGWLHHGPAARFGPLADDRTDTATIVCLVVGADHRRRGVARALLRASLATLAEAGFTAVEGRPLRDEADKPDAELFHGPLALYLSEGFAEVPGEGRLLRVRRSLR